MPSPHHPRHGNDPEHPVEPSAAGRRPRWASAYAPGVPLTIDVPDESLLEMLSRSAQRYPTRVALDFFGAQTRYDELLRLVDRAAEVLRHNGVRPGDRVALVLPNCPAHVVAFYAVLRVGGIVVEHNPLYTAEELEHQFADHGATVAIAWDKITATLAGFRDRVGLRTIFGVDLTRALPVTQRWVLRTPLPRARAARTALTGPLVGAISWDAAVARSGPIALAYPGPKADDVALLQYTGGTTGTPKGAMLTHRNLRANAAQGRAWTPSLRDGAEVGYAILPLFHAYGLTLCLTFAMSIGATLVLFPNFDVGLVMKAMRRMPATFLPGVPPVYEQIARRAHETGVDLTSVRVCLSGAVALPPAVVELWERQTGGLLVEGYGMTECSPVALGNPVSPARRPGTVGVPFPSTQLRIADPDHVDDPGHDRPVGEAGELLLRGPQVMRGYWNRPEETAAVLRPDGWLRTGDIGVQDEDGFITIVDRIKELVITGGFNVYPSEVEQVLRAAPGVLDAAVVGLPHAHAGEEVVAAVQIDPDGPAVDAEQLRAHCRAHLTAYKVPRRVVLTTELPRSQLGKVLRREVRHDLLAGGLPSA